METEIEIIKYIRAGKLALPPVSFQVSVEGPRNTNGIGPDLLLKARWKNKQLIFAAEIKRYNSDKILLQAVNNVRYYAKAMKANPLIVVPWLSKEQLAMLEQNEISGVDLCGNGVIILPDQLLISRSGHPNKFPVSRPIKRVYQGTSSLIARVFLLQPQYNSVSEIQQEINLRGGSITLSTVSKVLKQLEEDVIIEKSKEQIRLLQPDKLLERLKINYESPKCAEVLRCKITTGDAKINSLVCRAAEKAKTRVVLSGTSSVEYYAAMAREPIDSFYCTTIPYKELEKLGAKIDKNSRFPNVEFQQTDAEYVYFDSRKSKAGDCISSPIQTYLELATSDKRGQETAEQIREKLLEDLSKHKRG